MSLSEHAAPNTTAPGRAGFVLVGGASSRMGCDKAMLDFHGQPLAEFVATQVLAAAKSVSLVGDPERYAQLGFPVIPDLHPGSGPLGGILTALASSAVPINLIVACDMPEVDANFLKRLLEIAEAENPDCLIPTAGSDRMEPLCAVYNRRCLGILAVAFSNGIRKVTDGLRGLAVRTLPIQEVHYFQNVNTPLEWAPYHD